MNDRPVNQWISPDQYQYKPKKKDDSELITILGELVEKHASLFSEKPTLLFTIYSIPEEWIPVLQELGYTTVEKLKEVENV